MISKRLVLRQDPSVKRTICKKCSSLLISGVTSTVRQKKLRGQRKTVVKCLTCGLTNRFLSNPNYKLWCEQPEALLENQPKTDQDKNPVHQKKLSKEKGSSVKVTDEKKQVS
ncbi:hypothetical protein XENTR_v10006209 [Xenopus tropicalis]|nr:hypothetical protein XENTR_v10006209 [Xenopus tropicalis]